MRTRFGQNFLTDMSVVDKIISALAPGPDDTILEIGPGRGVLSNFIIGKTKNYIAVEIDRVLLERLTARFEGRGSFTPVNMDFLKYGLSELKGPVKIVGNLPYYAATPIIEKILPSANWSEGIFMVQKEVADRICSQKDKRSYGVLSVICQYYAVCEHVIECGPECFDPPPEVRSSVIKLTNRFVPQIEKRLVKVVKAAFSQKRKTIHNSISATLQIPKPELLKVLQNCGIEPTKRAENLSYSDYQNLTKNLTF